MKIKIGLLSAALVVAAGSLFAAETTLTLIAAAKNGDNAAVQALLQKKADVNSTDRTGATALHMAAEANRLDLVDLLIKAGANVKAETRYKVTPMALAASNGNASIIQRLLDAGVDANSTSSE